MAFSRPNIYCSVTGVIVCLIIHIFYDNVALNKGNVALLDIYIAQLYWWPTRLRLGLGLTWLSGNLEQKTLHSSVWCLADADAHKICTFKNLCYVPLERQFIFVLTNDSVMSGINTKSELKSLELSSLPNHNQFTMNIATVIPGDEILNRRTLNGYSVYILWRFKRDNIMHVIHDDLLPLYVTYSNICSGDIDRCVSKFQLAFLDGGDNSDSLIEWYKLFSNSEPLHLQSQGIDTIICFDEVRTGLVRSSTWFQYGFDVPQGPLNSPQLTSNTIRHFSNYITGKFHLVLPSDNVESTSATAVLFSRKINRKILNEDFLLDAINDTYHAAFPGYQKLKILRMDLSVNNTKSILESLMQSKVVVGMHGAIMILSIFLPPGSVVVELFPFGIVPEYVSPLKALSVVQGVNFLYESWQNMQENNSRAHPEALPIFGGIAQLSQGEQLKVKSLNPIPAMVCCHHPAYLYRMFQDTAVDLSFKSTFQHILKRQIDSTSARQADNFISRWWYPASVSNATCELTPLSLNINWNPPINVEGMKSWYELTIAGNQLDLEFVSVETVLKIAQPVGSFDTMTDKNIDVWIKCVVAGEESMDTHVKCSVP